MIQPTIGACDTAVEYLFGRGDHENGGVKVGVTRLGLCLETRRGKALCG